MLEECNSLVGDCALTAAWRACAIDTDASVRHTIDDVRVIQPKACDASSA